MSESIALTSDIKNENEFKAWQRELDQICRRRFSLSFFDLPEMSAREAFEAGAVPKAFFHETVVPRLREEHGTFVDELMADVTDDDHEPEAS